jgi:thiamine pyrophosphokinase
VITEKFALIITGGLYPSFAAVEKYIESAALIIAADSGLDTAAAYGLKADFIIGDFDSVKDKNLFKDYSENQIISYSSYKDYTDTELAMDLAFSKGFEKTVIAGGGGGRLDHTAALLALFDREKTPLLWLTHQEAVYAVEKFISLKVKKASIVSLFPCGKAPCTMSSKGLHWPLDNLSWEKGSHGLSNIAADNNIEITVKTGRLVLITETGNIQ